MGKSTTFTALSLEGDPRNLAKGPVKLKLFHETGVKDQYAEVFTNISFSNRRLEIREKDEHYRSAIVRALVAP